MAGVALATLAIFSCDDDTLSIGSTLTNDADRLIMTTATYSNVTTKTIVANPDSVMSVSSKCYFGQVKDPQTGTTVTSDFTTQFNVLEYLYVHPKEEIGSVDEKGEVICDSCDLIIYLSKPYKNDDSLTAMKMHISELSKPLPYQRYFVSYDPSAIVRDAKSGGISANHMFTYQNRIDDDNARQKSEYMQNVRIVLNQPYTDKNGNTYNNYGTYLLRQYMANKSNFANAYVFGQNVCPGLYFQITDGLGFYSQIDNIGLRAYYNVVRPDTAYRANMTFAGTREVLQTTKITNDQKALKSMADEDDAWTYIKSPAGLFTEVTLPIDDIKRGHEKDSLLAASITFQRMNNETTDNRYFDTPQSILMVPRDSLYTFFIKNKLADDKTSYMTSFASATNTYAFSNISTLVNYLWKRKTAGKASANWNKVVLVPVSYSLTTSTSTITKIGHDMSLTSTKLLRGNGKNIAINVVYAKFQK